jgi:hypothetical protein
VSESTVLRGFNHAFPIWGRLCMPNLVPYDKFRPGNIEKAWEYLDHIARISPERLKYRDDKLLKGALGLLANLKETRKVLHKRMPS